VKKGLMHCEHFSKCPSGTNQSSSPMKSFSLVSAPPEYGSSEILAGCQWSIPFDKFAPRVPWIMDGWPICGAATAIVAIRGQHGSAYRDCPFGGDGCLCSGFARRKCCSADTRLRKRNRLAFCSGAGRRFAVERN